MKKSILEIYALAVCFATVVCFVIAVGIAAYDVIQIANPEFTLNSHEYSRHQSNDAFWNRFSEYNSNGKDKKRPQEDELTKRRLASYQQVLKTERRDAFQSITKAIIIIIIDIVFFSVHWQIARRAREANITT